MVSTKRVCERFIENGSILSITGRKITNIIINMVDHKEEHAL